MNNFPGLKPQSAWPMALEELCAKLDTLEFDEVFHQPFDLSGTFTKEAIDFINNYFNNLSNTSDENEKTIYEEYINRAMSVLLTLKLLSGNLFEFMTIIDELKKMMTHKHFDKIFEQVMRDSCFSKRLKDLIKYYKDCQIYPIMRSYSICDFFNISHNILYSPRNDFGSCTSITTDSKYLYILLTGINGGMLKVGTGTDSIRGKVYLFEKMPCLDDTFNKWVYAKNKLYMKSSNANAGYLTIINPETFKTEGKTKLLMSDSAKHPILKKRNENYVLLSDGEYIYTLLLEPVINANTTKEIDKDSGCEYPGDIFTHLELVCYRYPVDSMMDGNEKEDKKKLAMIEEVIESFTGLFSKLECRKALIMNKWDVVVNIINIECC
jgi:hypothetical protein